MQLSATAEVEATEDIRTDRAKRCGPRHTRGARRHPAPRGGDATRTTSGDLFDPSAADVTTQYSKDQSSATSQLSPLVDFGIHLLASLVLCCSHHILAIYLERYYFDARSAEHSSSGSSLV